MSMSLMVKAMQTKVGNPLRKLVLIKLADNANDLGECWPSYQHIADQCEIGRSTVRKHIKELEKQGFLTIENRDGPKGNTSNLYRLTFDNPKINTNKTAATPVLRGSTPVAPNSTGVAPDSTPPVAPDSTRTSHSLEPVTEPPHTPKGGEEQRTREKLEAEGPSSNSPDADALAIVELFNEVCSERLGKALGVTRERKKNIDQVCKLKLSGKKVFSNYNKDAWSAYFHALLENPFNTGAALSGWKADFDWAIKPDNVIKVLERKLGRNYA